MCMRCGAVDTFKPRFLASVKFCDDSGDMWVNCIGDQVFHQLFNKSEQEVFDLKKDDSEIYHKLIRSIQFSQFKVKLNA